jgi:hypothetical protein
MTIEATIAPADIEIASAGDKPSVAFPGGARVWLAGGLLCPHCRRQLSATDVAVDDGDVTLICAGCHRDLVTVWGSW